jgi:hypothetical protein
MIERCNQRDAEASIILFTAFRLMFKYLEDLPCKQSMSEMAKGALPVQPRSWHMLEGSLLKSLNYNLSTATESALRWWNQFEQAS